MTSRATTEAVLFFAAIRHADRSPWDCRPQILGKYDKADQADLIDHMLRTPTGNRMQLGSSDSLSRPELSSSAIRTGTAGLRLVLTATERTTRSDPDRSSSSGRV